MSWNVPVILAPPHGFKYSPIVEITRRQKRICYFKHFDPKTCSMKPKSFYKLVDEFCKKYSTQHEILKAAVDYVKELDYKKDFEELLK